MYDDGKKVIFTLVAQCSNSQLEKEKKQKQRNVRGNCSFTYCIGARERVRLRVGENDCFDTVDN